MKKLLSLLLLNFLTALSFAQEQQGAFDEPIDDAFVFEFSLFPKDTNKQTWKKIITYLENKKPFNSCVEKLKECQNCLNLALAQDSDFDGAIQCGMEVTTEFNCPGVIFHFVAMHLTGQEEIGWQVVKDLTVNFNKELRALDNPDKLFPLLLQYFQNLEDLEKKYPTELEAAAQVLCIPY